MLLRSLCLLSLLFLLLGLVGCASQSYSPESAPRAAAKETKEKTERVAGEEELEAIPEPVGLTKQVKRSPDTTSTYVEAQEPPGVEEADVDSGYRVQIFASSSMERAEEVASQARSVFTESVYVEYSVPLYKVRVGNFLSKDEAMQFRQRAIEAGYEGAWVAEAIIEPE
ncbi:MAG: SPOR domain-containing protein [Candidatus Eiseniibacteriota bacterium]|nr:MAG: SPOR domain-containing protein [Candidatus Eisenbacteria bacterium]